MKTLAEALADIDTKISDAEAALERLRAIREYLSIEIRTEIQHSPRSENVSNGQHLTQREAAERVLRSFGRPARVDEILDVAIRDGLLALRGSKRNLSNSLYGAMMRANKVFRRAGPGTFELVDNI